METEYTTIRIDIDINKLIEKERTSFSETPNDILRILLGMDKKKPIIKSEKTVFDTNSTSSKGVLDNGITVKGVTFNNGTELRGYYNGVTYYVVVKNGKFHYNGKTYQYPSAIGNDITGSASDGWRFLHYLNNQTGKWEPIKNLRISVTQRNRKNWE